MKQHMFFAKFFLILFFACTSFQFFAQNSTVIPLNGSKMRAPLEVNKGQNSVAISGLKPGNTYGVIASRAVQGQLVTLELAPSKFTTKSAREVSVLTGRKNSLRFTATAEQVDFLVTASTEQKVTSVPMFLSVFCETCAEESVTPKNSFAESFANLQVVPNITAQSLINNTLIGGDCFRISNVTTNGSPLARGTFSNGSTNLGIGSGMVMSTGRIDILPGPNSSAGANGGFGPQGFDADLSALVDGELHDVNVIEFDFTPTANTVQFDFVFGSEEYCEYVGTEFNDVFGFFISGPGISGVENLAVIPGTGGVPVTTNNVNHLVNTNYYVNNSINFFECLFQPATHTAECELDGWTKPITAVATVIPCSTYHIKLAIADVIDQLWDSAVFLRANSFNAGGTVSASPAYHPGQSSAYEGCTPGSIRFARSNGDVSQPLTVNFAVSPLSTATAGVDYETLTSPMIIPAGQSELLVPVNVFSDGVVEGQEEIILLIDNSCQCQQATVAFLIDDKPAFNAFLVQDTLICAGQPVPLFVLTDGGESPFTYAWSTGDTTATIQATPSTTTVYSVTVTDACGDTATDDATVTVEPILHETLDVVLCPGGSIEIGGIIYTDAAMVNDTSYEQSQCGRITTYTISLSDPAQGSETVSFCPGDAVTIGGNMYNQPGTVIDTLATANGCDSIVTYTLEFLPQPMRSETISFCPGESVVVGGVTISDPGTLLVYLSATVGCDTVVTYTFVLLPEPTRAETISFCPGETVTLGGNAYTQSGTVVVHEPAAVGCDTVVTYTLVLQAEPTRAETIRFCPGETIMLGGNVYTQPGTVVVQEQAAVGCDTIVTYTLQYLTPAPSNVAITCPGTVSVNVASGANGAIANYADATASTNCPCPGMDIVLTSGLASGSNFPLGNSEICYRATDACGNSKTCCFNVSVAEENPCDTKVIGCMKYELLTITQDQAKKKTYRIRVTNNCANELIYTAIQTPDGLVATAPANNATYIAPSGNEYLVRNPNFTPFYSVRFRATGGGIANGESDILRYTLPAQADVTYIHIISRLSIQQYYEAHLNTFYCPVGITPANDHSDETPPKFTDNLGEIIVFPNPTEDAINVDMSVWDGEKVHLQALNSQGQRVLFLATTATLAPQRIELPKGLADGLYFLEVSTEAGEKEVVKFVVRH